MGCEIELPPNNTEADRSRAQTSREEECSTEHNIPNSVSLYERLEPATHNCKDTYVRTNTANMTSVDTKSGVKCEQNHEHVEAVVETSKTVSSENGSYNVSAVETLHNEGAPVLGNSNSYTDDTGAGQSNATKCDNNIMEANGDAIHGAEEVVKKEAAALSDEKKSETGGGEGAPSSEPLLDVYVQKQVLEDLDQLKSRLDDCKEIPKLLYDVSLNCLKPSTIEYLSYHLDPEGDVLSSDGKVKDYRGMAEWIGLENVFIKYISRSPYMLKTREVLSKWLTREEDPVANIKNLRECLKEIDRPDVFEDMSLKIAQDAVAWKKTKVEAQMTKNKPQQEEDTSWQLTRHDVVSGEPTLYTCCLVYADEDEGMVQILIKLYKSVYPTALFFLPQFDLKQGKFVFDTTATVIEERCQGKVIFIISEYFFASNVCRFAVNFCKEMQSSKDQGNLIPFKLSDKYEYVPRVLRGTAGIRWFRKTDRQKSWSMLTDSLLGGKMEQSELEELKQRMDGIIERDREFYLSDPPYDGDTPQPGDPISVYDPAPEVQHFNPDHDESLMAESLSSLEENGFRRERTNFTRVRHFVRKKIFRRLFGPDRQRRIAPPSSDAHQPPIVLPRRSCSD